MIYDYTGNQKISAYTLNQKIGTVYDIYGNEYPLRKFLDTAVLTALPGSVAVSGNKQGACTDGEYIYQTAGDATNYTYMQIIKYKISDGTYSVKRFDGTPNFGHANDMTYNPNDNCIYVGTMLSDGSIIVLNAQDLSYIKTVYAKGQNGQPYSVWQFCFDRFNDRFYSANESGFAIYDANWNYLTQLNAPTHLSATGQGCETDGFYIYRITYNPNIIDVISISDGARATTITNPMGGEPETMMYDWGGNYYLNRNSSGVIFYSARLFEQ